MLSEDRQALIRGMNHTGTLYVVGTPIGNLGDITIRAIEVLKEVDLVIAENKDRTMALLSHIRTKKRIVTISSYSEERRSRMVLDVLHGGQSCALISSAGTPCISDPGHIIVRKCLDEAIDVRLIPGPSAATGAFSISGVAADKFLFYGFLPQKVGKKRKIIREFADFPYPIIFYESPWRILETLVVIQEECADHPIVLFKELTKIHENILRGSCEEVIDALQNTEIRGEFIIILDVKSRKPPDVTSFA